MCVKRMKKDAVRARLVFCIAPSIHNILHDLHCLAEKGVFHGLRERGQRRCCRAKRVERINCKAFFNADIHMIVNQELTMIPRSVPYLRNRRLQSLLRRQTFGHGGVSYCSSVISHDSACLILYTSRYNVQIGILLMWHLNE